MNKIDFPVVGIGASAGGLEVLQQFFDNIDAESDMAYVVITHLAPEKPSSLDELLEQHTGMEVKQVRREVEVEPNHIYIIPPNKELILQDGHLLLEEIEKERYAVIDVFFRSLAKECEKMAIGVILSGSGSDGTLGLRAIKEYGGVTMAQDPQQAKYGGMPLSAINTELVDFILPVNELARKVVEHRQILTEVQVPLQEDQLSEEDAAALEKIFRLLVSHKEHDFKHYKRSSVLRRLQRRMFVTKNISIRDYQLYLENNIDEIEELFKDLLISVTNFFRDPEAFDVLEKKVIPKLFEEKDPEDPIRVWVPGCATGEEAYSLGILLQEYAATLDYIPTFKIFGTDISEEALRVARKGVYPESIAADVSDRRLRRYFHKENSGYRVAKEIQEKVLISRHDILSDPPFSNQDLISCRNLLIYFNQELQNKVLNIIHYSLRPERFLFLGVADSTVGAKQLFEPVDESRAIYKARQVPASSKEIPSFPLLSKFNRTRNFGMDTESVRNFTFDKTHYSLLAQQYAPASIIIDDENRVMHSSKGVGEFLRYSEGEPTRDLLNMVSQQLKRALRTLMFKFNQQEEQRAISKNVKLKEENEIKTVKLVLRPIKEAGFPDGYRQITFEKVEEVDSQAASHKNTENIEAEDMEIVDQLESELEQTKEHLQQTIEQYEASNEELMASNEELQSMNEELQTTTEELETSREELQSVNEELRTVNEELENKVDELRTANDDLKNLMEATEVGIIFVDKELSVKLFTENARKIFHLIHSDVGRPLSDVNHELKYDNLIADIQWMLKNVTPVQKQVSTVDGEWYIMQIKPYITTEKNIRGAVITFVDVTELKEAEQKLAEKVEIQKQLQQDVLRVEKKERWSIGQYLHDELSQNLLAAKTLLDSKAVQLEPLDEETREELKNIKGLIIDSLGKIRELSHFILPLNEEDVGTVLEALQMLANQTEEVYHVSCTASADETTSKIDDQALSSTLYYIAQEAVSNAIKHGEADTIDIALSKNEENLHFTIKDNGSGYDPGKAGKGEGINIMKYRAELLEGSLEVEPSPDGKGTVVRCNIPMNKVNGES